MKLKAFFEKGKLEFNDMYFSIDTGTGYSHAFAITPEEFITFAKADFFKADKRGLINALSNAKRAIDCQVDAFLQSLGFDPKTLDKAIGKHGIASLGFGVQQADGPLGFRFLQSLGVATPAIVGRMRRLRNLLEHEYKTPRRKDVGDAIDIAELFVQACKGRMNSAVDCFSFGSGKTKARGRDQVAREFYISFHCRPTPRFEVRLWDHDWIAKNTASESPSVIIDPSDEAFVPLLKLNWQTDWDKDMSAPLRSFLSEIGFRLPSKFRVVDGRS